MQSSASWLHDVEEMLIQRESAITCVCAYSHSVDGLAMIRKWLCAVVLSHYSHSSIYFLSVTEIRVVHAVGGTAPAMFSDGPGQACGLFP